MTVSIKKVSDSNQNPVLVERLAGRVEARIIAHALQNQTTELLCNLAGQKNFSDTRKTIRKLNAIRKELARLQTIL